VEVAERKERRQQKVDIAKRFEDVMSHFDESMTYEDENQQLLQLAEKQEALRYHHFFLSFFITSFLFCRKIIERCDEETRAIQSAIDFATNLSFSNEPEPDVFDKADTIDCCTCAQPISVANYAKHIEACYLKVREKERKKEKEREKEKEVQSYFFPFHEALSTFF
jgi:hypothetical protein